MTAHLLHGLIISDTRALLLYNRANMCSSDNAKFGLYGRLASEVVFLHLVNSKCMPILLYSLEVCSVNKADIRSLDFHRYPLLIVNFL